MKPGAENRKKTIAAGALGTAAVLCLGYAYNQIFGGSSSPAPAPPAPATTNQPVTATSTGDSTTRTSTANTRQNASSSSAQGTGAIPGVAAQQIASASTGLDPTLDQAAMLRTESLVYSGAGRNIFSATYTAPPPAIPSQKISPRPVTQTVVQQGPPPPPPTCPPSCPPINLKFFGTAARSGGPRQAFLLQGENVYLASPGDIVARKYKIGAINANSLQVTDLQNNNTQTLPLQTQ